MRVNKTERIPTIQTHEGGRAVHISAEQQLRRSVMTCMLWENTFYEDGESIAKRIEQTVAEVKPEIAAHIAIEARSEMKLRHAPLWVTRAMVEDPQHRKLVAHVLEQIIQRPDEMGEFLAMYWMGENGKLPAPTAKRRPIPAQVKRGLRRAFTKFDAYQLAKYNRDAPVTLRDVMFLVHPKPKDEDQAKVFKQLADKTLGSADTWETRLSSGTEKKTETDKRTRWESLLREKRMGAMALLRNLRNMQEAGVSIDLIRTALSIMRTERVLPFRFITAARYAPQLEPELEVGLMKSIKTHERLPGLTILLLDVSGSMWYSTVSEKSELRYADVATALAMIAREICDDVRVCSFSNNLVEVPPRHGFALRDIIVDSQSHGGTMLGASADAAMQHYTNADRIIIFTDEQAHDDLGDPRMRGYVINVAANKNGVGYKRWVHVDGFSEATLKYIVGLEALDRAVEKQQR
jgi:hypothetical protein